MPLNGQKGAFGGTKSLLGPGPLDSTKVGEPQLGQQGWVITGVTKDSFGTILGSCVVKLFYTATDILAAQGVSDPTTGAYSFPVDPGLSHYVVAYKAGPPDVRGTSNNTLVGV